MPRIFKGSESTLRLLISKTGDYQALTEIKIKLYTTDIENAIEIIDGIQVCKNIAIITLAPRAFMGMEDGLINYIIDGATEDDVFHTERQSNYMLKSLSYINEDGVATQTMTIESNGEYRVTPNDGLYVDINVNVPDLNGSYDDGFNVGYSQGQADMAAKARVLNVTENGNYLSKFSDPIIPPKFVTGVYADGTEFHNYAELNGAVYNTKIKATKDSRLEFWFKGKNTTTENRRDIIIVANGESSVIIQYYGNNNTIIIFFGSGGLPISNWDNTVWHHLIISRTEGFWIDGEHIDYSANDEVFGGEFLINGDSGDNNRNSNGTFGMIKIDDTIIIPTANGFLNTNTGELLEVVKNGKYTYTEDGPIYGEGELYKTINVDVKINIQKAELRFGNSTFRKVPEWVDFEGVTNMESMFSNNRLQTLEGIDFSNIQNMAYAFQNCALTNLDYFTPSNSLLRMNNAFEGCRNLRIIPNMDLSSVLDASSLFEGCGSIEEIGDINFENATKIGGFLKYYGNRPIRKIGVFNVPKVDNMNDFFYYGFSPLTINSLTEMGGFIGLKCNWDGGNGLDSCPNLTYQSCINVLNGLADVTELGGRRLKVHANFLTTVGDEISIGTAKGWNISA